MNGPQGMNFWEFCDRHAPGLMILALIVLAIVFEVLREKLL